MKRTREEVSVPETERPTKRPEEKQLVLETKNDGQGAFDSLPAELISETCAWLVEEYPLRPDVKNPLGYLHCVSKTWQDNLTGGQYMARLRDSPNSALHTLTKLCFFQTPIDNNYLRELTGAYSIMTKLELFLIVLNAASVDILRFASQQKFDQIDKHQFSRAIRKLSGEIGVDIPCYIINDTDTTFERKEKEFFENYLEGNSEVDQLLSKPPHLLVKWLFIEDLYRPTHFTWPFELFTKYSCANYHMSKHQLANLISPMSNIALPRVRRSLLLECFTWPMTLAALVNDREFVNIFKAEIMASNENDITSRSYPRIVKALQVYVNGGEFVVENVKNLEDICKERGFLGDLGFPMGKIRTAFEPYLPHFVVKPKFLDAVEDIFV